jgi:hypothetical protein
MEWKDHQEENMRIILASMEEKGDTVENLSDGTTFSRDFVDGCLSGTFLPGPRLQEIILARYDLDIIDGQVSRKN